MKPMLEMTLPELTAAVEQLGEKPFRAKQLAEWVWKKGQTSPAAMSNVPNRLVEAFDILSSRVVGRGDSADGTFKLLLEMADGQRAECVLIPTAERATACLSTQVGCAMGCTFCATGADRLVRNLSAGEMLEQVLHLWREHGGKPTNVVFMGMGEPLANYDATVAAVRAIVAPDRLGISARRVTVSTVGLPGPIRRLAAEDLPITLAISLHAPNDAIRRQIIPIAERHPLEKVLAAAEAFYEARRREVTLEYCLLRGVNDSALCAEGLARIAGRLRCNVNVLEYNPVAALPYERPSRRAVEQFVGRLKKHGVNVNRRRSRGQDADAACGQLRSRLAGQQG